ncbi:ribonuclease E inhibitor RraB [Streptomyces sp. NBC_01483]|uniref:ribonuclease E inhibitor RraB n=1 Tax=Streptomyces sp. NBC_01483 TaxID=2903883 RepID=UPI002E3443FE|nr:ribonuclease E inhibitor RraB [Streptomyces sp. NBC_01483]
MSDVIPYTHWAYFPDEASARGCAEELADYVTRVRKAAEGSEWLLLAGRDVAIDDLVERHGEVEAIVTRHGGHYDGGEATYLDGEPVVDPMLTGEWPAS